MSKDAAEAKAKAKQQSTGKTSAPDAKPKSRSRTDGKDFGDSCVRLKISDVKHEKKGDTYITRLALVIPPNAHVGTELGGFVDGMPGARVFVDSVGKGVASGFISGKIDPAALASRSVLAFCQAPASVGVIAGKILPPQAKDGEHRREGQNTILTLNVGRLHGVKDKMKGHVKGYRTLNFTIVDSRIRDTETDVLLNGASGMVDVVLNDLPSNR